MDPMMAVCQRTAPGARAQLGPFCAKLDASMPMMDFVVRASLSLQSTLVDSDGQFSSRDTGHCTLVISGHDRGRFDESIGMFRLDNFVYHAECSGGLDYARKSSESCSGHGDYDGHPVPGEVQFLALNLDPAQPRFILTGGVKWSTDAGVCPAWDNFVIPEEISDVEAPLASTFPCQVGKCTPPEGGGTVESHYHGDRPGATAREIKAVTSGNPPGSSAQVQLHADIDVMVHFGPWENCSITSQTVATSPSDRSRTQLGIGERVNLAFTGSDAKWTLIGEGQLPGSGNDVVYAAGAHPGSVTIIARDGRASCSAQKVFSVLAPSKVRMRKDVTEHTRGRPDIGMWADIFIAPDTVSFEFLDVSEQESTWTGSGVFAAAQGQGHKLPGGESGPFPVMDQVEPGLGSKVSHPDHAACSPTVSPPFVPGRMSIVIPWQYQFGANPPVVFDQVEEVCTLAADGQTLTLSKAGAVVTATVDGRTQP
jgi:hypothetical protein